MDNVLRKSLVIGTNKYLFECHGCGHVHYFTIPEWAWNGSWSYPSLSHTIVNENGKHRCIVGMLHGVLYFDQKCTHCYAGQAVKMIPWD